MARRDVERGEVVVVESRPRGPRRPGSPCRRRRPRSRAASGVSRCRWPGSSGSPGSVTSIALLAAGAPRARRLPSVVGALVDQRLERPPGLVAALADRGPLLRAAGSASSAGSASARPCGRGSAPAAPRPARARSPRARARSASSARRVEALERLPGLDVRGLSHRAGDSLWTALRTGRGSRSSRRSATRRRPGRAARGRPRRRPRRRPAGRPARSAPSTNSDRAVEVERRAAARPAPGTSATARPAERSARLVERGARDRHARRRAPMLARTAFGPNGSAVRALRTPRRRRTRARRAAPCRRCRDRRRRAGRPPSRSRRPGRAPGPALRAHADHPRARARAS